MIDDQDGLRAPFGPAVLTHLCRDERANLPGDRRLGQSRTKHSAAHALDRVGFHHYNLDVEPTFGVRVRHQSRRENGTTRQNK